MDFPQTTFNIGVISSDPAAALTRLSTLLGLPLWNWQSGRIVDLVVLRKDRSVYKVWVFDREEMAEESTLMQPYINRCNEMIDMEEVELSRRGIPSIREDLFTASKLL